MSLRRVLPFTAIVGQERMKRALVLNAVSPSIGGVLIRGEKGTAKSTAVRALAELLPEIEVVKGCPFGCDPHDSSLMCELCRSKLEGRGVVESARRRMRVVNLPLGATEDRVVGTLNMEKAIKEGIRALEPGILAEANRGILYIDEVNLLDDHVADVLLDAAAMGVNIVEREGISVSHPSRFILVGTMNPEEGELRPQLLDRFGLQVEVSSVDDVSTRADIVRTVEEFESDPEAFSRGFEGEQQVLREKIVGARQLLSKTTISDGLVRLVAGVCVKLGIVSHRAEITVVRCAKAIAALDGRHTVEYEDVKEAMSFALPHRMRRRPFEPPSIGEEKIEEALSKSGEHMGESGHDEEGQHPHSEMGEGEGKEPTDEVFGVGDGAHTDHIHVERDRDGVRRERAGRSTPSLSKRRGRYVGYELSREWTDIALDATIREAAVHQRARGSSSLSIVVKDEDIRGRVRARSTSVACCFVVDASGSMGAMRRMEGVKGAVLSLLSDAYLRRDRVAMVAFRGRGAQVLLPMTSSVELALGCLTELPTGGKTPLASGLETGMRMLDAAKRKDRDTIPLLVLISDGRANISIEGQGTREEIIALAEHLKTTGVHALVIDTERGSFGLGYCREIAMHSGGQYYKLDELTTDALYDIVSGYADACRV
ncbi:MAG: magnesium chelatase subunit D family protein [Methermicoccaceae archaeon]